MFAENKKLVSLLEAGLSPSKMNTAGSENVALFLKLTVLVRSKSKKMLCIEKNFCIGKIFFCSTIKLKV